jgi:HEAT repeats
MVLALRGATIAALGAVAMLAGALIVRRLAQFRERTKLRLAEHWRPVFTRVALDENSAPAQVRPPRARHMAHVMEEWNAFQDALRGSGTERLNELARRIGIDIAARRWLRRGSLGSRILAIRTLGHLRDHADWQPLQQQLFAANALLAFYAAAALIQIDAQRAMPGIAMQLAEREEWPGEAIAGLLKEAGTQVTREPIRALLLSLTATKIPRLLPWLGRADPVLASEVAAQLLRREAHDARIVAAALLVLQDPAMLPEIRPLAVSPDAEVRKNLAIALGHLGDVRERELLAGLMGDSLWWVRYRAAQALFSLRGMTAGLLLATRAHLTDRYARDMFDHVRAEEQPT